MTMAAEVDPGTAFLMEAFEPATRQDPYPLYAKMREQNPLLAAGNGLWFAFTHQTTQDVLRSPNMSSDERRSNEFRENLQHDPKYQQFKQREPLMLFMDPPDHTRLRKLVSRAFTPRTVERLVPRIVTMTDAALDEIAGAGPVDLREALAYPIPIAVICELLGVPEHEARSFQDLSDDLTLSIEPGVLRTPEQETAIEHAYDGLQLHIGDLLQRRRVEPGDDLVSGLLAARDGDDKLSEIELINMVILLLLAGHETTVNLIGNGAVALLRNPDQLRMWQDDPSLDRQAVDELLRYDSPVQFGMRVVTEDYSIGDVVVPAFDQITCLLGAANRDPAVFDNPDQLDLRRHNSFANMSFGGGIHHCLGMALARTEGELVLGSLLRRFKKIELVAEPVVRPRFVLRGYESIMIEAS